MWSNIWRTIRQFFSAPKPAPVPTPEGPTHPDDRTIGVIVTDGTRGIGGASVVVDGGASYPLTDSDGYTSAQVPWGVSRTTIRVTAQGYLPAAIEVILPEGNKDYVFGTRRPDQISLPPLKREKPLPAPRLPIRASFCSSWDRKNRMVFDPQYFPYLWWRWKVMNDTDARDDFYAELDRKWRHGVTHVVLDPPDGTRYDRDWMPSLPNWMNDGDLDPQFIAMCNEILSLGFVGVFYCYGGGQTDAVHIYDGQLRRMARRIKAEGWVPRLVINWAWESFGRDPECTAKQNSDAWQLLWDELGPDCMLAEHVGSKSPQRFTWASFPVEPDDPTRGDEAGAHYTGGGKYVKVFFGQLEAFGRGPKDGAWEARMIEGLDRYLPTGTPMPIVGKGRFRRDPDDNGHIDDRPMAIGPYWFGGDRPVGPMVYCDWEPAIPFDGIRGNVTQDIIVRHAQEADGLSITSQGCLPVGA